MKNSKNELIERARLIFDKNTPKNLKDLFLIDYDYDNLEENFFIRTMLLLLFHGKPLIDIDVDTKENDSVSAIVKLNEDYEKVYIENLTQISFGSIIPTIMMGLDGELFNYSGSMYMWRELCSDYRINKDIEVREYINMMFGMLYSKQPGRLLKPIHKIGLVVSRMNSIMNKVRDNFAGHYVYIDTDTVYFCRFAEIEDRFHKFLGNLIENDIYRYVYYNKTIHVDGSIFLSKKKFVINGNQVKGLKVIRDDETVNGSVL